MGEIYNGEPVKTPSTRPTTSGAMNGEPGLKKRSSNGGVDEKIRETGIPGMRKPTKS